jgi:hypothetical protein
MNAVATGALMAIALAQLMLAWAATQPSPEEIHFIALQEFCKEEAKKNPAVDTYFVCMARLGRKEARYAVLLP